jgi:hypothetical protein
MPTIKREEEISKSDIYWQYMAEPTDDPPSSAIRTVVFAPPGDETDPAAITQVFDDLSRRGFATWITPVSAEVDLRRVFAAIDQAELFVTVSNRYLLDTSECLTILRSALQYSASKGKTRHYGVSLDGASVLSDVIRYVADSTTDSLKSEHSRVAAQIANTYFAEEAGASVREEAKKERLERLEQNASVFVDEALNTLQDREQRWKRAGYAWHAAGFIALLAGIGAMLYLSAYALPAITSPDKAWPVIGYLTLKSIIIIGLLVAASKYAFTLGRSYMNEALKNADRIHAINFGRFYLKAYGESATWIDVKEVFQTWNIARESGFASLDTSQFDPQILATAVEIAKSLSPVGTKGK